MATAIIKFHKRFECWTAGDVAGFPEGDERVKTIVDNNFGVVLDVKELSKEDPKIDPSWGKRLPKEVKEELTCPICGKKFKTKLALTSHKKKEHAIS